MINSNHGTWVCFVTGGVDKTLRAKIARLPSKRIVKWRTRTAFNRYLTQNQQINMNDDTVILIILSRFKLL